MMRRREALETRRRRVVREALRFFSACASSMIRWLHRHFSRKPRSRRCSGLQAAASSVGAAILPGLLGLALDHDARWFALGLALLSLLIAGLLRLIGRRDGTAPQVPEGQ